jgi:hypothetical protein
VQTINIVDTSDWVEECAVEGHPIQRVIGHVILVEHAFPEYHILFERAWILDDGLPSILCCEPTGGCLWRIRGIGKQGSRHIGNPPEKSAYSDAG